MGYLVLVSIHLPNETSASSQTRTSGFIDLSPWHCHDSWTWIYERSNGGAYRLSRLCPASDIIERDQSGPSSEKEGSRPRSTISMGGCIERAHFNFTPSQFRGCLEIQAAPRERFPFGILLGFGPRVYPNLGERRTKGHIYERH